MADKSFKLEIVTPKQILFSGEVTSFTAPGVMGGFQVLRSHAPLLSNISIGEVKLVDLEGTEHRFATSGGVVEVRDNKVVLLAETAERSGEIDVERAEAARDRARRRLAKKSAEVDADRARLALFRALNRLKVSYHL
ncbi:MAG TPA: F0F1 ATP synthase subunit epsilon [Bacteroidetes bacterium]|nr:MAG: ATP synthase F1 subunit epsilon [Ignavibacteria bacterium GWA2_54_16]HCA79003.1 F0F1 ATP synthase subunit epsilon [Bacteroidota bacterium]